tara:strand:+ start:1168 stop:1458 length:291 start_codon:yes stop_codon:yes gene_type:complete
MKQKEYKPLHSMTEYEFMKHKRWLEKSAKNNLQKLLKGNDWLASGNFKPQYKLQQSVSWYELETMSLNRFLELVDVVTAESPGTYTLNDLVHKLAK